LVAGRLDLLTAVLHEMGHLLGRGDLEAGEGLMAGTLPAEVRRADAPGRLFAASVG
jgi:hypothetical protein